MNDEDQENETLKRPTILGAPACFTVPGFGFLVALNPDWCFTAKERNASRSSSTAQELPAFPHHQRPRQL
jgi:Uma2 family endonuclease